MEITFEDEEVLFTFEGKDYSAMVDFYDQDEWKVFTLGGWDTKTDEWNGFNGKERSSISEGLTKVLDREIEQRGDNLFEEAYHGRIEATDWKDCYD